MAVELREIPPAPRPVRWGAVLWRRLPLLLGGAVLTVYGGMLTMMFWISAFSSHHQTQENALNERGEPWTAKVRSVEPRENWWGDPQDVVEYEFETRDGQLIRGNSFCAPGQVEVGQDAAIEFVPDRPDTSRIAGGHLVFGPGLHGPGFWLTVVPGLALLLAWLAGVLGLRRTLRDGDVAIAVPFEVRRVRMMMPTMLDVRFRFRDRRAVVREGRQWVLARSRLGERLLVAEPRPRSDRPRVLGRVIPRDAAAATVEWRALRVADLPQMVVVHDRADPRRNRLIAPGDFAGVPPPASADLNVWLG